MKILGSSLFDTFWPSSKIKGIYRHLGQVCDLKWPRATLAWAVIRGATRDETGAQRRHVTTAVCLSGGDCVGWELNRLSFLLIFCARPNNLCPALKLSRQLENMRLCSEENIKLKNIAKNWKQKLRLLRISRRVLANIRRLTFSQVHFTRPKK